MANRTEEMGLAALGVARVAQGFAIERQVLVRLAEGTVPVLQRRVELIGRDADEHVTDDRLTGHLITAMAVGTAKACSRRLSQILGPFRNGLVPAHTAQGRRRGDGQDGGQGMTPSLATTRVTDVGKDGGERAHLFGTQHDGGLHRRGVARYRADPGLSSAAWNFMFT